MLQGLLTFFEFVMCFQFPQPPRFPMAGIGTFEKLVLKVRTYTSGNSKAAFTAMSCLLQFYVCILTDF